MKAFKQILLIIALSQTLISCRWFTEASTPYFAWTNFKIPDGTPTFKQGFKDGCSSVLYARGNDYFRSKYTYHYDPVMIGNVEYRFGHQRGWSFCFQYVLSGNSGPSGGFDKFLFPNPPTFDATAGNINKAWFFASDYTAFSDSLTSPGNGVNGVFDVLQKGTGAGGIGGLGETVFGGNPLWASGSRGQFLGWD